MKIYWRTQGDTNPHSLYQNCSKIRKLQGQQILQGDSRRKDVNRSLVTIDFKRFRPAILVAVSLSVMVTKPAAAFCEDRNDGSTCHTHMVESAMPFLRPQLLDQLSEAVLFPDDSGFLNISFREDRSLILRGSTMIQVCRVAI